MTDDATVQDAIETTQAIFAHHYRWLSEKPVKLSSSAQALVASELTRATVDMINGGGIQYSATLEETSS
jgi:hypothetical protein